MMPIQKLSVVFLVLGFVLHGGCDRGPAKPKNMPELFPCRITITQAGNPLEGAAVVLAPMSGNTAWISQGATDAQGVAEIKTHVDFKGVPEGEYAVRVSKVEMTPSAVSDKAPTDPVEYVEWDKVKRTEKRLTYRYVKPEFDDSKKTPHKITITQGKNEATFDVGEPIKEEVKK